MSGEGGGGAAAGGAPGPDGSTAEGGARADAGDAAGAPKPPAFAAAMHWSTGAGVPTQIAIGDVDGDGAPDVVVALDPLSVVVLRNTGSGLLAAPVSYPLGAGANAVALGDLDGDGDLDVAVDSHQGSSAGHDVSVLLNGGAGVLGTPTRYQATTIGQNPSGIAVGDVNHDGRPDLVVAGGTSVALLLNAGMGSFTPGDAWSVTGKAIRSVATADLDGDGFVDLVAAQGSATSVIGVGMNQFGRLTAPRILAVDGDPNAVTAADLNGDGRPDLVVANRADVNVLLGRGDGTFAAAVAYPVDLLPWSVAVGDLNGDGWPDLVVGRAGGGTQSVAVLMNRGDATFAPLIDIPVGDTPWEVAVADLNRDGKPDIVVGIFATGVGVLINQTP